MKRTAPAFLLFFCICILCIFYCILPLCRIAALVFSYSFKLYNYPVYIAVLASFSLITAIYSIIIKKYPVPSSVLSAFLLPLSIYHAIEVIENCGFDFILLFVVVSIGSSVVLFFKTARSIPKILSLAVTSVLLIMFFISSLFHSVFGSLSNNIVIKSVSSPDNSYTAEVISSDQGAFGGNTFVNIHFNRKSVNLLFGGFAKHSERIYSGKYGEYEDLQISWKDNHTLIINGAEYKITS
ncbi:MAG TPA: DUF5412 family protein [Bacillota bacterium]|nr:DUF5412 family protein [Bacillota bacterium]HOK68598.1 DUF5412 family protein [Bacillota bacterium]HPP84798.1 DUF5412 family protein [Bacillota bacterium]